MLPSAVAGRVPIICGVVETNLESAPDTVAFWVGLKQEVSLAVVEADSRELIAGVRHGVTPSANRIDGMLGGVGSASIPSIS